MISYFKDLGITSVELMPVQEWVRDKWLIEKGLTNYWGYNPIYPIFPLIVAIHPLTAQEDKLGNSKRW